MLTDPGIPGTSHGKTFVKYKYFSVSFCILTFHQKSVLCMLTDPGIPGTSHGKTFAAKHHVLPCMRSLQA